MVRPHRPAGLTFSFGPTEGYRGLVKDRATIVILASGSDFITGMNRGRVDMAAPYLRDILRFIGVHDLRFVAIGPTVGWRPRARRLSGGSSSLRRHLEPADRICPSPF
jgi:FMN-dependent NADH-azoreductase